MLADVEILNVMIRYTENKAAISVFDVKVLQQSSNGGHRSNKTLFGWNIDDKEKMQARLAVIILLLTKSFM